MNKINTFQKVWKEKENFLLTEDMIVDKEILNKLTNKN